MTVSILICIFIFYMVFIFLLFVQLFLFTDRLTKERFCVVKRLFCFVINIRLGFICLFIYLFFYQMSVVSSRTSSVASILKGPGVRAKLVGQQNRVNFKLPKNLKAILLNFENGCDRKVYEDLICTLRDAKIKV